MLKKILKSSIVSVIFATSCLSYAADAPPSPIKIDTVTEVSLPATADLMGTLHSRSFVTITAGVSGRLEWLQEPGIMVRQGDVLAKMDLLPLQLKQAEQKAQIKRASINSRYFKNELHRLQKLKKTNSTSQFQLDQTKSQYELAQSDIEIATLKLKQVEDELRRATVKAPFDGVVTERIVRAGTDINRSDALLMLLDTEHLEVRLYVPVKYLAYVRKGLTLNLQAIGQSISTQVTSVIPSTDPLSQTFEVRIQIPEHLNEYWTAGQLVKVTVPVQDTQPSLTVHRDALILRKEGTFVVKVDAENKAHRLLVKVGKGTFDRVTIQGDLASGDKVAIRGAERLKEGQSVVVQ
ncbi:MAG: efflux RND transporter periplasmic adaptor subunit [Colwellia sp.]|nr:efflux RND transporter periplasmic adaptor subunit [Colwellia sp.]